MGVLSQFACLLHIVNYFMFKFKLKIVHNYIYIAKITNSMFAIIPRLCFLKKNTLCPGL